MQVNDEEMIEVVRKHYETCNGRPAPLQALKRHYGREFNFKKLGLGGYGAWMEKHKNQFSVERDTALFLEEIDTQLGTQKITPSEEDLLVLVNAHFAKSELFAHRRHVLSHIRSVYGNQPFGKYGYGTFPQFLERHGLDMGIAKKEDFRSFREWKQFNGRKM